MVCWESVEDYEELVGKTKHRWPCASCRDSDRPSCSWHAGWGATTLCFTHQSVDFGGTEALQRQDFGDYEVADGPGALIDELKFTEAFVSHSGLDCKAA